MSGGGGGYQDFADVYEDTWLVELQLDSKAPSWRTCTEGLNIEGECENVACKAFGEMVIHQNGFESFNLMTESGIKCPKCKRAVVAISCGFYRCAWKFEGKRSKDDFSISSTWRIARGEKYHRFDTDEAGSSVKWDSLLIVVKSETDAIAAKVPAAVPRSPVIRKNNICSICWTKFGSTGGRRSQRQRVATAFTEDASPSGRNGAIGTTHWQLVLCVTKRREWR